MTDLPDLTELPEVVIRPIVIFILLSAELKYL